MFYFLTKIFLTAFLVGVISEISRRSSLFGAILASVPLVSVLAMIWLYVETSDADLVARLCSSIFWMVLPSLSLFLLFPLLVRMGMHFSVALSLGLLVMILLYGVMILILRHFGIQL